MFSSCLVDFGSSGNGGLSEFEKEKLQQKSFVGKF